MLNITSIFQLTYSIIHEYHPTVSEAFALLPSSSNCIFLYINVTLDWKWSSQIFLPFQPQLSLFPSVLYIYIYIMQKQYHQHIKWIQNVKTLFPNHTSCQVQVCFSGSLVSGRWDCCCSGICLSQEQMHEASTKSYQLFGHATKRGLGYLQLLEIGECSQRWADWST